MATRLEPGQVQLRSSGGVPMQQIVPTGVDYVAPRVESRTLDTMANILDRMSTSAFGAAKEMRQREAIQFAAENEITPEQLQLAKEGIPQAIPGLGSISGDFTAYGQALKKARTLQLAGHFEIEGRNELAKLLTEVQNGRISSKDVAVKIKTMTDGLAKSLAQVDGEASIKFRATMATHGNTVLSSAYESELKRVKDQERIKFDMDFDNGIRLLEATVSQKPDMIDKIADVFRTNVANQALLLGDLGLQKEYSTKFETALRNAKINALTKEFSDDKYMVDPMATLNKIRAGNAGKLSPVLQSMIVNDFEAVAKVTANYMIAVNNREAIEKQKKADVKDAAVKQFLPLYDQALIAPEGSAQRKKLTDQIAIIATNNPDVVPLGVLKDLREPPKGEGNAMVEFNVLQAIYEGRITKPEQIWAMTSKGLSSKQAVAALKLLYREDKQDNSELDRGLSQRSGIPVVPGGVTVIDPKGAEFKRRQELLAIAKDIEARYAREGKPPPTPREILSEIDSTIEKQRNSEGAKAARKSLEVFEKKDWINGKITRQGLPSLEKKAGNDINRQRELTRIKQLLDQAGE